MGERARDGLLEVMKSFGRLAWIRFINSVHLRLVEVGWVEARRVWGSGREFQDFVLHRANPLSHVTKLDMFLPIHMT